MSTILMNFRVPSSVRKRFDTICKANGRTRTSVLVELMSNYVLQQGKQLVDRENELGELDKRLQESLGLNGALHVPNRPHRNDSSLWQTGGSQEHELPISFFSSDQEYW